MQFSQQLDIPKAKVFRLSGFTVKDEYEIDNTKLFDMEKDPPPQQQQQQTE